MKRIFAIACLLGLLAYGAAWGWMDVHVAGSGSVATSACALSLDIGASDDNTLAMALAATTYYNGFTWQSTTTRSVCRIDVKTILGSGDISAYSYSCKIWNDSNGNGTLPVGTGGQPMATAENSVAGTVWDDGGYVSYTFATPVTFTANTIYHITFDHGGISAANWGGIRAQSGDGDSDVDNCRRWGDDGVINQNNATWDATVKIYE